LKWVRKAGRGFELMTTLGGERLGGTVADVGSRARPASRAGGPGVGPNPYGLYACSYSSVAQNFKYNLLWAKKRRALVIPGVKPDDYGLLYVFEEPPS